MSLPDFENSGVLPKGIHNCSGNEFIDRFCRLKNRRKFVKPISDIFDFAKDRYATEIFIGGSFITLRDNPNDFDCVMVFEKDEYIPSHTEKVSIDGLKFDILYASKESPNLIDSFIKLFSTSRYGQKDLGVVQIDLYKKNRPWEIRHHPSDAEFEIIKKIYNDRQVLDLNEKNGLLISVHGLFSRAEWMKEISPIASSQGWIYAPFVYETNKPNLLFQESVRQKVIDEFREWLYDITRRYNTNSISVIAHSFGTYILSAYLNGFDLDEVPIVGFDSVILTGSILNCNFDWEKFKGISVGKVYNMVAKNDEFVKFMPTSDLKKFIGMSTDFGTAGLDGFSKKSDMVFESRNPIFTHTNTIKRDIIETKWMPFIAAHKNSLYADFFEKTRIKH